MAVALTAAVFVSGIATFAALAQSGPLGPNPHTVVSMLILDLLLLLPLAALIGRRIARVWAERRAGAAGARLHVRLVVMFSVVAITPAILVAVFASLLVNIAVEQFFNTRVSTAVTESLAVANVYLEEHQQVVHDGALNLADDINRYGEQFSGNSADFAEMVENQAVARGLTDAIVFDISGRVLAQPRWGFFALSIERIPKGEFERARAGDVAIITGLDDERVRALVRLQGGPPETFLYVGRMVDPKVLDHMARTSRAVTDYQRLQETRSSLEITFSAIFALVALLMLMGAIWVGLTLATQLATPIIRLIDAAERVRGGDLTARVEAAGGADELGSLSRAFNRMTSQLAAQRDELMNANRELDERRRFTETVLAGVSAGVIGLDRHGVVELPNRSAAEYLSMDPLTMIGLPLATLVPELAPLLEAARARPERSVQDELTLRQGGRMRGLLVRIVAERVSGEPAVAGYVVTLDDITELLAAQRKAAWADVARRIAHEIKNPLTPIQLSAERLKRKYLKQIETDRETFLACTDTIVRQVGDIGRMVDEFSAFARMPAPVMKEDDLAALVRQAIFLARTGYPSVTFSAHLPGGAVKTPCDGRQIGQALTNLLKNAVEGIQARQGEGLPKGRVRVTVASRDGRPAIAVEDNGKGLPTEQRERLTEPYVTTRMKGTGLGLAIVTKIMEDHGGSVTLEDREGGGARVSLIFGPMVDSMDNLGAADTVTSYGA
jgi:two-component system nitrogen regulation sensor histidine kinase NtrY